MREKCKYECVMSGIHIDKVSLGQWRIRVLNRYTVDDGINRHIQYTELINHIPNIIYIISYTIFYTICGAYNT